MNAINRLRAIHFSRHRGRALYLLEQATLRRHPLTWREYVDELLLHNDRCPLCGSPVRIVECSNGYCISHQLHAIAEGDKPDDGTPGRKLWRKELARLRANPGAWTGTPEPTSERAYAPLAVIGVAPAENDVYDIVLYLEDGSTALPFPPDYGVFPSWYAASASMSLADALATEWPIEAVRVELVTDSGRVTSSGWLLYLCPE